MLKKSLLALMMLSCFMSGALSNIKQAYADEQAGGTVYAQSDIKEEKMDLEWAKSHSKAQVISIDHTKVQGDIYVFAVTVRKNRLNNSRDVLLYAECKIPVSSQDFGGPDEYEGKLYLPQDTNYVKYNGGYIKSWLMWAQEDTNSKYDKKIFKAEGLAADSTITVTGNNITLVLDDEEFTVNIDDEAVIIDTAPLDEAIVEHWNEYSAAKNAGLEIEENTENAYLEKNEEARKLIEKAKQNNAAVTNNELESMRKALNEAFSAMTPKPFDKHVLSEAIKIADEKIALNGSNGKRYTKDSYDPFIRAYAIAKEYMELKDLKSIVPSQEAGPITTHRDIAVAAENLNNKAHALVWEDYKEVDTSGLEELYYKAVDKIIAGGRGYTTESRTVFYRELENAGKIIFDKNYATKEDVDKAIKDLNEAFEGLKEESLDSSKKFTITMKYIHPSKDAVSDKIKEYFRDSEGHDIEDRVEALLGEEYVINIDNVRKFSGYKLRSFHYGADDGTLGLVKIIRNKEGKQFAVFKANTANLEAGTALVLYYEEGSDAPDSKPEQPDKKPDAPDNKPEQPDKKPDVPDNKPEQPNKKPNVPDNKPEQPNKKPEQPNNKSDLTDKKPDVPNNNSNKAGSGANNNTSGGSGGSSRGGNGSSRSGSGSGGSSAGLHTVNRTSSNSVNITPDKTLVNEQGDVPGEWIKNSKGWWYKLKVQGQEYAKNQWVIIKHKWYIFGKEGYMLTSWQSVNNKWYFVHASGEMAENTWIESNGRWYYVKADGSMAVNETTPDGYRVNASGECIK